MQGWHPPGSRACQLGFGLGHAAASSACSLCSPSRLPPLIQEAEYLQPGVTGIADCRHGRRHLG